MNQRDTRKLERHEIKDLVRKRTREQMRLAKKFYRPGIFTSLRAEPYCEDVMSKLNSLNLRERALDKLGLDEEMIRENEPIFVYRFERDSIFGTYWFVRRSPIAISPNFYAMYVFLSDTHVFIYKYGFSMVKDEIYELSHSFAYKDVTEIGLSRKTTEVWDDWKKRRERMIVDETVLSITVPGNTMYIEVGDDPQDLAMVRAAVEKIKEKQAVLQIR